MSNVPFTATVAQQSGTFTFTHTDGKAISILKGGRGYDKALEILKQINETREGSPEEDALREELYSLTVPASRIAKLSHGEITVEGGNVLVRGKIVNNVIGTRILWMLDHDEDPSIMLKFYDNLIQNPSYRAVTELFGFMESNEMGITRDGYLLAYKRVTDDFQSIHRGAEKFDNSPGSVCSMPRNEVDDNPNNTCSSGLHVCSMKYLPNFGVGDGNRIVICKIHPKDVVSVPIDYDNSKIRVCEYEVLREVHDEDGDILKRKPVWQAKAEDMTSKVDRRNVGPQPTDDLEEEILGLANDISGDDFEPYDEIGELSRRQRDGFFTEIEANYSVDVPHDLRHGEIKFGEIIEYVRDNRESIEQSILDIACGYGDYDANEDTELDEFSRSDRDAFIADVENEHNVVLTQRLRQNSTTIQDIIDFVKGGGKEEPSNRVTLYGNTTQPDPGLTSEGAILKAAMESENGIIPLGEGSPAEGIPLPDADLKGYFVPFPDGCVIGTQDIAALSPELEVSAVTGGWIIHTTLDRGLVESALGQLELSVAPDMTFSTPVEPDAPLTNPQTNLEIARHVLADLDTKDSGKEAEIVIDELLTDEYITLRNEFDDTLIIQPMLRNAENKVVIKAKRK